MHAGRGFGPGARSGSPSRATGEVSDNSKGRIGVSPDAAYFFWVMQDWRARHPVSRDLEWSLSG
jgi:hypothetical protein